MPLTKEQRIEYLKKAREAKALKAKQLKEPVKEVVKQPEPEPEPVKVEKSKKIKKVNKSLDLSSLPDNKPTPKIEIENEEVVEVITEVQKLKKPKRIIKKVIQQEYESESDVEEIVEVIQPKYKPSKPKKVIKDDVEKLSMTKIQDITATLFNY